MDDEAVLVVRSPAASHLVEPRFANARDALVARHLRRSVALEELGPVRRLRGIRAIVEVERRVAPLGMPLVDEGPIADARLRGL